MNMSEQTNNEQMSYLFYWITQAYRSFACVHKASVLICFAAWMAHTRCCCFSQEQYRCLEGILKKCLKLLASLARANDFVQMRMFERLDILLKIKVVESEVAIALKEVSFIISPHVFPPSGQSPHRVSWSCIALIAPECANLLPLSSSGSAVIGSSFYHLWPLADEIETRQPVFTPIRWGMCSDISVIALLIFGCWFAVVAKINKNWLVGARKVILHVYLKERKCLKTGPLAVMSTMLCQVKS